MTNASVTLSPLPERETGFFLRTSWDTKAAKQNAISMARYIGVPALIFLTPAGQWQVTNHQRNAHPDAILVETVEAGGVYA